LSREKGILMADTAPENREAEAAIKDAGTDLADAGS
jgi:hypothetical protein